MLDPDGKPRYVGHSKDVAARAATHWKHRHSPRLNRQNPAFYGWLQSFLICPDYRILAVVPYDGRYQHERTWTLLLRKKYDLFNISDGPAPLRRPWLTERNRLRRAESPSAAAA